MSRNGSGSYSLPVNSWNPAINSVPATASDWQALINDVAQALTQSLSRDGQTVLTGNLPMGGNKLTGLAAGSASGDSLRFEQLFSQGQPQDLASAATTDIGAQLTTVLNITGTTTITSFGSNYNGPRFLRFADALTLTHSASLVLPGGANITTAAGDSALVVPVDNPASGWRVAAYTQAAAAPGVLASGSINGLTTVTLDPAADYVALADGSDSGNAKKGLLPSATDALKGIVELADASEAAAGTDAVRALTPATLRNGLNAAGAAPVYACRAWVNFNGTGTVAIRASGNVSSITDNGAGDYTVNFTAAMPDANYSVVAQAGDPGVLPTFGSESTLGKSYGADSYRFVLNRADGAAVDRTFVSVAIFR